MTTEPRATVVVVNYNGAHLLRACLDGLRQQDAPAGYFHTVVVDNDSRDGSVDLLRREYPEVEVLESGANLGFAGGNNLALARASTEFAVLLNNDAVPEPNWLRELLAPFDEPGGSQVGVTTGKVLFMPRFLPLTWQVPAFVPGPHDTRELGARIYRVEVAPADGSEPGEDVAAKVLWERLVYGAEGDGDGRFWWTRPNGELLVPIPAALAGKPLIVRFTVAAEDGAQKKLTISGPDVEETTHLTTDKRETVEVAVPATAALLDVVNNVGGIVLVEGYGADRGFQEIDRGQYEEAVEVFTACGNGMAVRTQAGRAAGWFDETFFMYYEDTDLSWRLRSHGWAIRYVPTAVLRHIHAASSKEWSPTWMFHVDRNRLLMLTKDATRTLALRAVLRYPATSASMALRSAREAARTRRRPALRPHLLRARVLASYVRLLPRAVAARNRFRHESVMSRGDLQKWLVTRR